MRSGWSATWKDSKKKSGKKVKLDVEYVVKVPEVSLVETASLPALSLKREELNARREALMGRKVGDWADFIKASKPKRELRMLAN